MAGSLAVGDMKPLIKAQNGESRLFIWSVLQLSVDNKCIKQQTEQQQQKVYVFQVLCTDKVFEAFLATLHCLRAEAFLGCFYEGGEVLSCKRKGSPVWTRSHQY